MNFLLPQGLGDTLWAMSKIESVARIHGAKTIDVLLNCGNPVQAPQGRALDFVRRFKCVSSARLYVVGDGSFLKPDPITDEHGHFRYLDDGPPRPGDRPRGAGPESLCGIDFVMIPNGALEKGVRLENWLPEYPIDWNFLQRNVAFTDGEKREAAAFLGETGPFVAFYLSCKGSNTEAGHNRGPLWRPESWIELGRRFEKEGLRIVVFGAEYDRDYFEEFIRLVAGSAWVDTIGRWPVMTAFAVLLRARFMVSYQCGLAMVPAYMGLRTVIFWRPYGDSLLPNVHVSCKEEMSMAWVPPSVMERGDYISAFYGRHDVDWITGELEKRGWLGGREDSQAVVRPSLGENPR